MFVHLRGSNGSGKSTVAKALLQPDAVPCYFDPHGYITMPHPMIRPLVAGEWIAIGKYVTACGGADTVKTTDKLKTLCDIACGYALSSGCNVIMEGILPSTVYQTWLDYSQRVEAWAIPYVNAFMSTSLDECLSRVRARRVAAGSDPLDFKPELVSAKFATVQRIEERLRAAGRETVEISGIENFLEIFPKK